MTNEISKKEYLKRYLENDKNSARKHKKKPKSMKPKANVPCLKIVDEDIDLKSINFGDKAEEDDDDEAPVVAQVIDERPIEDKIKELYGSSHWKKINSDETPQSAVLSGIMDSKPRLQSLKENSNSDRNDFSKSIQNNSKRARNDSGSDVSPRNHEKIIRKRHDSDKSISPIRNQTMHSDSDISPPRNHKQRNNSKYDSDSDISLSRGEILKKSDVQIKSKSKRHDSDSDISPPRYQTVAKTKCQVKKSSKRHDSDSDERTSRNHIPVRHRSERQKNSDSDISPPRSSSELSAAKSKSKKLHKTLSGLKAGLQNSETLQQEVQELKKREKIHLNMLDDEISGRNAETIIRDRKTGMKRDLNKEQEVKDEENLRAKEYQQKYNKWGKGIEQIQDKMEKFKDDIYEMSKPLARYRDDEDLDEKLKSIIHDDDPMSEYIKKKRKKDIQSCPVYSGPPAPPNRFGIMPGYRWDGVDRSNGFEKRYFEKINSSKAIQDEAYLWSIQDM